MKTIEAMHYRHGLSPGNKCRDCCNLARKCHHGKQYYKCLAYGTSDSMASDWRLKWDACGLYNIPFDKSRQYPLMHILRHTHKSDPAVQCDGQLTLEEATP